MEWALFGSGRTRGASRASFGAFRILNADGRYDGLIDWFGGRWRVTVMTGETDDRAPRISDFAVTLTGEAGLAEIEGHEIIVPFKDPLREFEKPIQENTYKGNNKEPGRPALRARPTISRGGSSRCASATRCRCRR